MYLYSLQLKGDSQKKSITKIIVVVVCLPEIYQTVLQFDSRQHSGCRYNGSFHNLLLINDTMGQGQETPGN
jgi:hypothetical protein